MLDSSELFLGRTDAAATAGELAALSGHVISGSTRGRSVIYFSFVETLSGLTKRRIVEDKDLLSMVLLADPQLLFVNFNLDSGGGYCLELVK